MSEHIYEDSDMEHERYHVIPFGSMREEIVRCRDCAKADWVAAIGYGSFTCRIHGWTSDSVDGFCAWGERKGDVE